MDYEVIEIIALPLSLFIIILWAVIFCKFWDICNYVKQIANKEDSVSGRSGIAELFLIFMIVLFIFVGLFVVFSLIS